jgi:hypothetical protein
MGSGVIMAEDDDDISMDWRMFRLKKKMMRS